MQAWTDEGGPVGMDVTSWRMSPSRLNSVSRMCRCGERRYVYCWRVYYQEFVDGRFDALRTWVWSICVGSLGKNGEEWILPGRQCDLTRPHQPHVQCWNRCLIKRRSRRLKRTRLMTKRRTIACYPGYMTSLKLRGRDTTTPSTTSFTSSSHSGGNARTSPRPSPIQELVPTLCVWSWSQHQNIDEEILLKIRSRWQLLQ